MSCRSHSRWPADFSELSLTASRAARSYFEQLRAEAGARSAIWSHAPGMCVPDVEQLLRLAKRAERTSAPEDVVEQAVAALHLLRRVEGGVCATRDDAILALHRSGESLQRIRERTGLSRARIHQIIQAASQP